MNAIARCASIGLSATLLLGATLAPSADAVRRPAPRWSADRRLTFHAGDYHSSINFARSLAAGPAGRLHAVWFDTRDGLPQVYTKRSADGGLTWGPDLRLSRLEVRSELPALAVAAGSVYVVWHSFVPGGPEIRLRRSADGGATWGPEIRLGEGAHPAVAASGRRVRVVWGSRRDGQAEVYSRGSRDFGATWDEETRISEPPYESWVATVEIAGERAWVGFVDYGDGNEEEYFRRSLDGGATWEPVQRLTHDPADSWAASIAVAGDTVHMAWFDRRNSRVSDADVEAKLDEAMALVGLPPSPAPPRDPAFYYLPPFIARLQEKMQAIQAAAPAWVQHGGNPAQLETLFQRFHDLFAAWTTSWEIYSKRSEDGGSTWGPDVRLTRAPGLSLRPSIAASGRNVHVVWSDGRDGTIQVYAKRSADGGATWGPDERLTHAAGNPLDDVLRPAVAVSGGSVYVIWTDRRDGNAEIYFKLCRRGTLLTGADDLQQERAQGSFRKPRRVTIHGYQGDAMEPFLTRDGRYLLFNNSNDPSVDTNLHYAERIDGLTFAYRGEIAGVNTPALEGVPTMDREGGFYFVSSRNWAATLSTVFRGRFSAGHVASVELVPGVSRQEPGIVNFDVEVSPDGNDLYFVDGRLGTGGGAPQTADLVLAHRSGSSFERAGDSSTIFRLINTPALEYAAAISADGRELFFTRYDPAKSSPPSILRAVRKSKSKPFGAPQPVAAIAGFVEAPALSPDGLSLYYHKKDGARFVIYRVTR